MDQYETVEQYVIARREGRATWQSPGFRTNLALKSKGLLRRSLLAMTLMAFFYNLKIQLANIFSCILYFVIGSFLQPHLTINRRLFQAHLFRPPWQPRHNVARNRGHFAAVFFGSGHRNGVNAVS